MNSSRAPSGYKTHPALAGAGLIALSASLLPWGTLAWAQPDYAPAHWNPPACVKYYPTGFGHSFCVIHDMEGYYSTTISYLNRCDTNSGGGYNVNASVHYLVNGLQNGSDSSGHSENNPSDPPAGDITQSAREQYYAWHAGCWNRYMFGTEHEGFVSNPAWSSEAMYQASAGLQRHLCDAFGIPKDRNHIIGHNEWQNSAWKAWMAANWPAIDTACNTKTDPGVYWDWSHFMALIVNRPPIASTITATTRPNQPLGIPVEKLLLYASDPDADPLSLGDVSTTSTNGGSVVRSTGVVTYTPATNFVGEDSFTYTVSDGRGGFGSGNVLVEVRSSGQGSGNVLTPTPIAGGWRVTFAGIPGRTYTLQRAEALNGPWLSLGPVTVGPGGLATYADTNAPPAGAYYRTVYP
jgi:N-acetyl-anhydromuramyl-L-alanine amidase AmpD